MLRPAICLALLALAVPATADDLDGDGHDEIVTTSHDRGSGYTSTRQCITDGASGETACRQHHRTAYSGFEGVETHAVADSAATRHLDPLDCEAPDREAASQAAMWLLAGDAPRWHNGPPLEQAPVCLSLDEAEVLEGGLTWWAPGGQPDAADDTTWTVRYAPRWYRGDDGQRTPEPRPHAVDAVRSVELVVAGQAVAVHDRANDRHQWIVNLAGGTERGDKIDRHLMIEEVEWLGSGSVEVTVAGESEPRVIVVVEP